MVTDSPDPSWWALELFSGFIILRLEQCHRTCPAFLPSGLGGCGVERGLTLALKRNSPTHLSLSYKST